MPSNFLRILLIVFMLFTGCGMLPLQFLQTPASMTSLPKTTTFEIRGDKIYQHTPEEEFELFFNISNIEEARLGPDRRSIHFKFIETPRIAELNYGRERCANLDSAEILEKLYVDDWPSDDDEPSLLPPPWDYEKIGRYGTVQECTDISVSGNGSGYLVLGDYFAYIKYNFDHADLFVEDLKTGEVYTIPIVDADFLQQFTKDWRLSAIASEEGFWYMYPRHDASLSSGKLVLVFGRGLVIAVDLAKEQLIDGLDLSSMAHYGIWFLYDPNSPLVLTEASIEGGRMLTAVLDLSSDQLAVRKLKNNEEINFEEINFPVHGFSLTPYWDDEGLIIPNHDSKQITVDQTEYYTEEELTQLPPPGNNLSLDEWREYAPIHNILNERVRERNGYLYVECSGGTVCNTLSEGKYYRLKLL